MQNQILTSEELLNELNASLPLLSSSRTFKSPNVYLSSNSFPRLWKTYNTVCSDSSSIPDTPRGHKSRSRKHFGIHSSDPDSSDVSRENLKTSGPVASSCSSNHQSRDRKIPSPSSSTWGSPPKRRKHFRRRTTAKAYREDSNHSLNQLPSPKFTFCSNSLPDLRTRLYKKYLREIESIYLKQRDNVPFQTAEWEYQSESNDSDETLSPSSCPKNPWYGPSRRRIPPKRGTSPSIYRSSSRRYASSRTSSHHSRRSSTSGLYSSSRSSSNSDSLSTNGSSSSDTVHHRRSQQKCPKDFDYLTRRYPRFCGDNRPHYDEYIPHFQQDSLNEPDNIDCADNKQTDVCLPENTKASSWLSLVLRPFVKIRNFVAVIKSKLISKKGDTSNSKTTRTPALPLPSETRPSCYGNLDRRIQSIEEVAHQPACEGRHRFISKTLEMDTDLDFDDSGVWESF